jgi:hypothetical protein
MIGIVHLNISEKFLTLISIEEGLEGVTFQQDVEASDFHIEVTHKFRDNNGMG